MHKLVKYVIYLMYIVLGSICIRFIKIDPNIVIFGARGGMAFEGNSKYLFLSRQNVGPKRRVWIAKDTDVVDQVRAANCEAYHYLSFTGFILSAKASSIFITHSMFDCAPLIWKKKQIVIDLWHGVPIKKISFSDKNLGVMNRIMDYYKSKRLNYLISHSKGYAEIYSQNMKISLDRIEFFGSPKIEALKKKTIVEVECLSVVAAVGKTYFYTPTFRDYNYDYPLLSAETLPKINAALSQSNSILLIKLHPSLLSVSIKNLSNVHFLDSSVDPYRIFPAVDILISDYSSLLTDFKSIYPNKDIVVYAPDIAHYTNARGFNIDFHAAFDNILTGDPLQVLTEKSNLKDLRLISDHEKCCENIFRLLN
ncbi:CDP-glycerol glycerophosphotransferase family protein [Octadecabacter sp.]|nr:CDP-glycerol glycerophosphotransferase family protein [Octadecabacter sp.]